MTITQSYKKKFNNICSDNTLDFAEKKIRIVRLNKALDKLKLKKNYKGGSRWLINQ